MTENVFISTDNELHERWVNAFPDAVVYSQVPEQSPRDCILWLVSPGQWLIPQLEAALQLGCPVVVMSSTPNETEAYAVVSSGAAGYCHLLAAPEQLTEVATVVANGGFWVGPDLMQRLLQLGLKVVAKPSEKPLSQELLGKLTARERSVAVEVAHGATNKAIARSLNISERTVKAHLTAAFEKLGVNDRVQLALLLHDV